MLLLFSVCATNLVIFQPPLFDNFRCISKKNRVRNRRLGVANNRLPLFFQRRLQSLFSFIAVLP
jgi:hypothetical protein